MKHTIESISKVLRANPVPLFAAIGLMIGVVAKFGFTQSDLADAIWLVTLAVGGIPIVWETARGMLRGHFASDVVAMLAIITSVVMQEYFAGVIIVLMQSGGEALENYSLRRASSSLEQLMARAPRLAQRRTDERIAQIPVEQVQIGDTLVVRPGDLVPVDGMLLSDGADVDEAALTGEPLARSKQKNDKLLSGSVNVGNVFEMRAETLSADSQYSRIVDLVRKAQADKPPLQRLADRYAVWFTPATLVMCGLAWLITGDPRNMLSVLVVATPCPLILAVPVAVISGINRAAHIGIIVKNGTAIEQIGHVEVIVFDKTGTLTHGTPSVERVIAFDDMNDSTLLHLAGSLEQMSSHLLAKSLAQAAQESHGILPVPTSFSETPGQGVEGDVDGHRVLVGSRNFLAQNIDQPFPPHAETVGELKTYVVIDRRPVGLITFNDKLRPGVSGLMQRLRGLGIKQTVMLTGDNAQHAQAVGQQAGIDLVEANLLPEDKLRKVKILDQTHGSVAMVGDGINDAPALAVATVGVAMGAHGTGISAEAADIVLLVDDVAKVADAVEIGQRMVRIAKQSIYIGLGVSFGLMVVASFGLISPPIGALLQEALDIGVILNALRAR